MHRIKRAQWLALTALCAALVVAACGSGDEAGGTPGGGSPTGSPMAQADGWDGRSISQANEQFPFFLLVINSQRLTLGDNRLQIALESRDGGFVEHAEGEVRLYYLGDGEQPESVGTFPLHERILEYTAPAPPPMNSAAPSLPDGEGGHSAHPVALVPQVPAEPRHTNHDGEHATIFTANVNFDRTGTWGIEVDVVLDGERHENARALLHVQERLPEPMVGEPVPASTQPTVDDVEDISEIDSSIPPIPEMHSMTVAEVLERGEPMVIAFTTPAFCQTRFCGPVMEAVVVPAWEQYGDRVQFIHIEPYDVPQARQGQLRVTETTLEWNLTMEPIIFIVDGNGLVAAKFDGILELEELAEALDTMLAGS